MANVLVVDDELFYREMVSDVLKKAGHEVIQAKDGKEALDLVASRRNLDVVLTDIVMPGFDGLMVLSKIRNRNPNLPVIMLSAHEEQRMVLQALRRGAYDYQKKPISPQELTLAVQKAIEHHDLQMDKEKKLERLSTLENGTKRIADMVAGEIKLEAMAKEFELLDTTVKMLASLLECSRVSIMLLDPKDDTLNVAVNVGMSKSLIKEESKPAKDSVSYTVLKSGKPLLVKDVEDDDRVETSDYSGQYKTGSFLVVPLMLGEQIVGTINANDKKDGKPFDDDDLYLLQTMSYMVAASLQLAVQASELKRDRTRLERLTAFQKLLIHYLEPEEMLNELIVKCQEMLNVVNVCVFLKDEFSEELVLKAGYNGKNPMSKKTVIMTGESVTGLVAKTGKMYVSNNPTKDKTFISEVEWPGKGVIRSILAAPIAVSGTIIGVIRLLNKRGDPFNRDDAALLQDVADSLSIAIRNLKLYEQLNHSVEEIINANRNLQKLNDELRLKAKEADVLKKKLGQGG